MDVTPETVATQHEWTRNRAPTIVPLVNAVRTELGDLFDTEVPPIDKGNYCAAIDAVFEDGDRAVNVAALVALLRDLDVTADYPGFVVDELLGRELAAVIAGEQPLRLLAEATFHFADVKIHGDDVLTDGDDQPAGSGVRDAVESGAAVEATAGTDDLDAALAAGVQTRLPGWSWRERDSPFDRV